MDHSWIKINYDADEDLLGRDLLVPCLKECKFYRRLTYSFTSATLKSWAGSLHHIVRDEVKIEILCDMSTVLIDWSDRQLITALEISINENKRAEIIKCNDEILKAAMAFDTESSSAPNRRITRLRAQILDYLIANGQLKINFAYPKDPDQYSRQHPLYHYKKGYFVFPDDSIVLFKGSANETNAAYTENYDDVDVYSSKRPSDLERLKHQKAQIDKGWEDEPYQKFNVIGPSEKLLNEIKQRAPRKEDYLDFIKLIEKIEEEESTPHKKATFSREDLYDYQEAVLKNWEDNGRRGLVKHATGSGKTFTSLCAIKSHLEENQVCLIIVPSKLLQKQWRKELVKIIPEAEYCILPVGGGSNNWKTQLKLWSKPDNSGDPKIIIAVLKSAASDKFIEDLNQGDHLMMVADEVHRLGSQEFSKVFNIHTGSRLGVSATPERFNDPIGTEKIYDYFERQLEPVYEIYDAIGKSLVEYDYHISECYLNAEESEQWEQLSLEIKAAYARSPQNKNGKKIPSNTVKMLSIKRARIAKQAEMKIPLSVKLLNEHYELGQQWLVYCDSIDQLDSLNHALLREGIMTTIYHSNLSPKQKGDALRGFEAHGGIMLSIRCLDEGVDIPSVSHALIIASDQNPRQFIQRRGRVLRKDRNNPDKTRAVIHDLVISVNPDLIDNASTLGLTELQRAYEFARYAFNAETSTQRIRAIARKSDVDVELVLDEFIYEDEDEDD